ncbi:MAG: acetyl-CoA carboxylase biotin carboxyl carrier protein [Pseudanabaenaceae cyanobacterium SKYGB_i_bin29]|nr:acetyl-CoA carboxylase biotin carboxyl carrier protein [Pseudanabaenaceae cyanobacterium SKYG29]MDW8421596.1 acetyl-CoA carboxylase biotin carboxyl carrier protein [Pseudanabaenaceae cyanobacterium SKYGB_i_bin29]
MDWNLDQLRELLKILNETDITELTLESGDLKLQVRKSETVAVAVPSRAAPAPTPVAETAPSPPTPDSRKLVDVVSPMVGTFYRSPAPGEPPFVEVGEVVKKGQTVCIIEAMKLMNEIEAEVSGRIAEILVENAQPIEFGQVLMRIEV